MKNIIRVFLTDVRRIGTNVVAVVMIMGLCVLPSLYAWFNIFSNWDPYGEESTSNLKIAVFSADTGEDFAGETINIGTSVTDGLKQNSTIGWVFPETQEDAIDGVYSGEYYAALIIPDDFTEEMISFLSGDVEHPTITYYENDKKNAIAPKITSKAKTSVQEEVNATFISTMAEAVMGTGHILTAEDDDGNTILDSSISDLQDTEDDLQVYISVLSSFIELSDAAQGLANTAQNILPNAENIYEQSQDIISMTSSLLDYTSDTNDTADDMIVYSLDSMIQSIDYLQEGIESDAGTISAYGTTADSTIEDAQTSIAYIQDMFEGIVAPFEGLDTDADSQIEDIRTQLDSLSDTIDEIAAGTSDTVDDTELLIAQSNSLANSIKSGLSTLEDTYENDISPTFDTTIETAQSAMSRAASSLEQMDTSFDTISPTLAQYQESLANGEGSLEDSKELAVSMSDDLQDIIDKLEAIENNEQYQQFVNLLEEDPDSLGDFISSPVNLETTEIYPIATYGSAMAPFYTVLALWVGALILVAIIHVDVAPIEGLKVKSYQAYFGRYILFFLMGQVQTLITVMGELFYIKIQCLNPFLFWLAAAITSMVFTLFMYSLTVALHNIGEALAVVIMVVQVAGAGGTYPIEILPAIYRVIYKYLPFPYAMNSMRETIGGMYQMDYWFYLLKLGSYIIVALLIGLILAKPFKKLNHKIEKSKEKTEIML